MDHKLFAWFLAVLLWGGAAMAWSQSERIVARRHSAFNDIQVNARGSERILRVRQGKVYVEQSRCDMRRPNHLLHQYSRLQMVGSLYPSKLERALVVGLGGASLSKALLTHYPQLHVDSIELDPEIARLAREFFGYKESSRARTIVSDARAFLEKSSDRYDLIVLDAFDGLEIPAPLRTRQFYQLVDQHLSPGGVVVSNLHRRSDNYDRDRVTLAQVFGQALAFEGTGLVEVLSSQAPLEIHQERWSAAWGFPLEPLLKLSAHSPGFNSQLPAFEDP